MCHPSPWMLKRLMIYIGDPHCQNPSLLLRRCLIVHLSTYFKYPIRADIIQGGSFKDNNTNNNACCNVERQTTLHTFHAQYWLTLAMLGNAEPYHPTYLVSQQLILKGFLMEPAECELETQNWSQVQWWWVGSWAKWALNEWFCPGIKPTRQFLEKSPLTSLWLAFYNLSKN